ncbi:MAG TPA: nitrilase-related carbon-nitrogen hydrolase [Terracidiphilus sp.]|jgi:apolipoprotein N-acyltransferase
MASVNNSTRFGFALLAVAVSAVLIWFGTGLFPMWPLLWFAPLPVLLFAARSSWWAAGLTAALAWAAGHLNLWKYFSTALHFPLAVQVEILAAPAVVFALAVLLYRALLLRGAWWSALLAFPAAWVSFEYILNLTSPHGTAMSLSYSELNFLPILQLASITGPWGISFLVLAFSSVLAIGIHLRDPAPRQAARIVSATLGVIVLALIFGAVRLELPPPPNSNVRVGLVASDLPANRGVAAPGADTERLLREYAAQAESLAAQGAKVIVLPEHLGEVVDPNTANADALFQSLADKTGSMIVVGVSHVSPQIKSNQARVYQPGAQVLSYNKHHLLPPFESMFTPGTTLVTMPEPEGTWGVAICKDMDFTQLSRHYGQAGAGLMLVPAWDFVLDRFEHGHIAVMRGVESGFAIARAARGGFLTVSDNRGRILAEAQSNSAPFTTLIADVPAVHDATLYLLLGDWFAWVTLATLLFTLMQLIRLTLVNRQAGH